MLVQGIGGVSIAALQFRGANVVATTSNDEKAGAKHSVNYREHPQWSGVAKRFTPEERGFDLVVDVGIAVIARDCSDRWYSRLDGTSRRS